GRKIDTCSPPIVRQSPAETVDVDSVPASVQHQTPEPKTTVSAHDRCNNRCSLLIGWARSYALSSQAAARQGLQGLVGDPNARHYTLGAVRLSGCLLLPAAWPRARSLS